jgi:hypothetical protein
MENTNFESFSKLSDEQKSKVVGGNLNPEGVCATIQERIANVKEQIASYEKQTGHSDPNLNEELVLLEAEYKRCIVGSNNESDYTIPNYKIG